MKRTLKLIALLTLSKMALAGPIGPPAGNAVLNQSYPQNATYNVSSGTVRGQLSATTVKFADGTIQATAGGGSTGVVLLSPSSQQFGNVNVTSATVQNIVATGGAVLGNLIGYPSQCLQADTNGNVSGTGVACGSGSGGSGLVNPGTVTWNNNFGIQVSTIQVSTITLQSQISDQSTGARIFAVTGSGKANTWTGTLSGNATQSGLGMTGIGYQALTSATTGTTDTAIGASALASNTGGSNNTSIGPNSLFGVTQGNNNTALGYDSGYNHNTTAGVTIGSKNTFIGSNAGTNVSAISNAVAIGADAVVTASNTAVLGGSPGSAGTLNLIVSSVSVSGLGTGQCVQTATGGLLTTTGAACGAGGSINGTISPSPQYQIPLYSASGTTTTLQGDSRFTFNTSINRITLGDNASQIFIPDIGSVGTASQFVHAPLGAALYVATISSGDIPALSPFYINNQTTPQSNSAFNVSTGIVTGPFNVNTGNMNYQFVATPGSGGVGVFSAQGQSSFSPAKFDMAYSALNNGTTISHILFSQTNGGAEVQGWNFEDGNGVIRASIDTGGKVTASSITITGLANTILAVNSSGIVVSTTVASGSGTPGGTDSQTQYNHAGLLAGTNFETVDASSISFNNISSMTYIGFTTMTFQAGTALDTSQGITALGVSTLGDPTSVALGNKPYLVSSSSGTSQNMAINVNGFPSNGTQNQIGGVTISGPNYPGDSGFSPALLVLRDSTTNTTNGAGLLELWEQNAAHNSYLLWIHGSSTRNSDEPVRFDGPTWGIDEVNTSTDNAHGLGKWKVISSGYQTSNLQIASPRAWDNTTFENLLYATPFTQSYIQPAGVWLNAQSLTNDSAVLTSSDTSVYGWATQNNHMVGITAPLNTASSFYFAFPGTPNNQGQLLYQSDNGRGNNNNARSWAFTTGGVNNQVPTYTGGAPAWQNQFQAKTLAQIKAYTPDYAGEGFYCSDCTTDTIAVSTGTTVGAFARATARTTPVN